MTERLLVKEAFGEYSPGDRITDAKTMKRVTASHPEYVLRETVPDEVEVADAPIVAPDVQAEPEPAPKPRSTRHTLNG